MHGSPFPFYFLLAMQSNMTYTVVSGASKLAALCATYPYQVIRSRIQVTTAVPSFPLISSTQTQLTHSY